jgi:acetylcholinesterase
MLCWFRHHCNLLQVFIFIFYSSSIFPGAFGGNKDMVTIYGESAGAGSISNQMTMKKSWDYFAGAILESGSFSEWVTQPMPLAQGAYERLTDSLNCSTALSADAQLACMLDTSTDDLFSASLTIESLDVAYGTPYNPTADGVEMTTHPWIALANGDVADVPIVHGSNTDEGSMFLPLPTSLDEIGLIAYWKTFDYSDAEIKKMLDLYVTGKEYPIAPVGGGEEQPSVYWWAGQRMLGDVVFSCPNKYTSQQLSRLRSSGQRQSVSFLYHFEYLADGSEIPYVQHTAEIPFVWHMNYKMKSDQDYAMTDIMSRYWGNFMTTFDPNTIQGASQSSKNLRGGYLTPIGTGGDLPQWPIYDASTDINLFMYSPDNIGTTTGLKDAECQFENPRTAASIREAFANVAH